MKKVAILALIVSLTAPPAMASGTSAEVCAAETQSCLDQMASELREKGWVGIELEHSDSGALTITRVEYDSPAGAAGLQAGDVLVALNGIAFGDEQVWEKNKDAMRPGKTIVYTVRRDGHQKEVKVELASIPEEIMAKWIGRHMLEHASVEVTQLK